MKGWLAPLMLGFGIAMAVLIGQRMSTDAMAVVVGVAVGVAASVPTSFLLVALLKRERRSWPAEQAAQPQAAYPAMPQPSVFVLNPADLGRHVAQQPYMPLPPAQFADDGGLRRLRVVGDDEWADQ